MKVIEYTDRPRKTQLLRLLQRMQRAQGGQVMVRHATLAKRLKCSERTIRRTIDQLVESGHIIKSHAVRPTKGGYLCVYQVRTDVIYRTASPRRRAEWAINRAESDHLRSTRKQAQDAGLKGPRGGERKTYQYKDSNKYRRKPARESIDRQLSIEDFLAYARIAGISDSQRGFLRLLASKFGVYDAWEAFKIALESGRARNPVMYAWGVIRKWYPDQRKGAVG